MMKRITWFFIGVIIGVAFAREISVWKGKAVRYVSKHYEYISKKIN